MKHVQRIVEWTNALIVTGTFLANTYFKQLFANFNAQAYYLIAPILLSVLGMRLAAVGIGGLVDRWRGLRAFLAGSDDIEGEWVNIVFNKADPSCLKATEFCVIRYRGGQYVISGDTWTLDGGWVGNFASGGSRYDGREFEYYYKAEMRVGGYGIISFSPHDALPEEFKCHYLDELSKTPHLTIGRRVSARISKRTQEERRDLALKFASQFRLTAVPGVGQVGVGGAELNACHIPINAESLADVSVASSMAGPPSAAGLGSRRAASSAE